MIDPIHISPSDLILGKPGKKNQGLDFLKKYQTVDARVTVCSVLRKPRW